MPDTRLIEQRNGVTFAECLFVAANTPEFVNEWERLAGKKLIASSVIDRMIDEATGYDLAIMKEFADFVYRAVFCTMED